MITHYTSCQQCRTVSTVSTLSTVSTVIARCYLHLRWYFFGTETVLKAEEEAEAKGFTAQAVCLGALPNQTKNSEQLARQINNSMEMLYIAELCHICLNSNLNINGGFLLFGQTQLQWIKKITVGLIHKKLLR